MFVNSQVRSNISVSRTTRWRIIEQKLNNNCRICLFSVTVASGLIRETQVMLPNNFRSERHKDAAGKYKNQENMHLGIQNIKVVESSKNDVGKRKGLSENGSTRTSMNTFAIGKAPFHVYHDHGKDEIIRSRSRERKDAHKTERKTKRDTGTVTRTSASTNVTKLSTEKYPMLRIIPRRARSSSNFRNIIVDSKDNKLSSKYFQRSNSESRRAISQILQHETAAPLNALSPKTQNFLSNGVKKRTSTSIQMWRDKMRRYYTGTIPKNCGSVYPVLNVNRAHTEIKSRENSTVDRNRILHHESSISNFIDKVGQNQSTNPNKSIKKPIGEGRNTKEAFIDYRLKTIIKCSNEVAVLLNNDKDSDAEANVSARSFGYEDNQDDHLQATAIFDGPETSLKTSGKVCYEKHVEKSNLKKRGDQDDYQISYECYYLEDTLNAERKKEESAPKLSLRFLRENVNAEQRRVIVGYLIRLGVHCNYSSHIIYQTIKLFDIIIDRILVETDNIQLIALACLWINLKREATFDEIPSARVILRLAKDMYIGQEKQLLTYERKILLSVNFSTRFADPFSLLFYYIWCANQDDEDGDINPHDTMLIYFCGSYLLDVTVLDESLCDISGCILAIAATELSLSVIYLDSINMDQTWYRSWRTKFRLAEWEERAISFTKQNIMRQVLESNEEFGLNVVYKKYLRSKHGNISAFLLNRMRNLSRGRCREEVV